MLWNSYIYIFQNLYLYIPKFQNKLPYTYTYIYTYTCTYKYIQRHKLIFQFEPSSTRCNIDDDQKMSNILDIKENTWQTEMCWWNHYYLYLIDHNRCDRLCRCDRLYQVTDYIAVIYERGRCLRHCNVAIDVKSYTF